MDTISQEEFNRLFEKCVEQVQLDEYNPGPVSTDAPVYVPIPKCYGPQPLTIEQYRKRQYKRPRTPPAPKEPKKIRGGLLHRLKKEIVDLRNVIAITIDQEQRSRLESKLHAKRTVLKKEKTERKKKKNGQVTIKTVRNDK